MSFTAAQVISAARLRIGNKAHASTSELKVADPDVLAEMRDDIVACAKAFGASSSNREVTFHAVEAPAIAAPAAPTLTPSAAGGTLATGTYAYRVTATYLGGQTEAGAAATAAVTGPTGSVQVAWAAVEDADGYHVYGRKDGRERRLATLAAGVMTWTDTGAAVPGGGLPGAATIPTGFLQDYAVAGDDVMEVIDVMRSGAHVPDAGLRGRVSNPLTDMTNDTPYFGGGFQDAVLDLMVAQERYRHQEQFEWDEVYNAGVRYLRVIPRPTQAEIFVVSFVTTTGTVESLPDEARNVMELAACRAMLECMLNRFNSFPRALQEHQVADAKEWARLVERQRNRYEARFRQALGGRGS